MLVKLDSAKWKEEALTTWRASLANRGVMVRNRHCGRLDILEECVTHAESRGKTLEAILHVLDATAGSL